MLRAVPNKTLGVAVLVAAILVFALMPILSFSRRMSYRSAVLLKVSLEQKKIFLAYVFIILGYFGTVEAVAPYTSLALLFTVLYYLTVLFVAAAPAEKTL